MKKSLGTLFLATLLFMYQHRYNWRFRKHSMAMGQMALFLLTSLGIGGSFVLIFLKVRAKLMADKKENDIKEIKE